MHQHTPNQTVVKKKALGRGISRTLHNGTQARINQHFLNVYVSTLLLVFLTYFVLRTNLQVYFFIFPISLLRKLRSEILLKLIQLWWNWDWSTILSSLSIHTHNQGSMSKSMNADEFWWKATIVSISTLFSIRQSFTAVQVGMDRKGNSTASLKKGISDQSLFS